MNKKHINCITSCIQHAMISVNLLPDDDGCVVNLGGWSWCDESKTTKKMTKSIELITQISTEQMLK